MTIKSIRNERLATKLLKQLDKRHYQSYYCKSIQDLHALIQKLIPNGSSVSWGGSESIRSTGVTALLKKGDYLIYDRDDVTTQEEKIAIYRKAFECDFYLSSVNAMSEDGVLVNIDSNGNRVAAISWGPSHVIFIVGMNKICQDLDSAIKRARSIAAPTNMARFDFKTPCQLDGACHNCYSADSICNYVTLQRMSHPAGRHIVILVDEDLGY